MKFYENQLFHIFNQGNNRQQIFFTDEHYQFFLWKMRAYLHPFGDLIAYALMPNHFHWQFYVKQIEIERTSWYNWIDEIEYKRRVFKYGKHAHPVEFSKKRDSTSPTIRLNKSIGFLQKAYARAINKEKDWSGSLFRQNCKAKDGWLEECITVTHPNGQLDTRFMPGQGYALKCFNYIHNNAKEALIVKENTDWFFSSARDYAGLRNGTLCNLKMGRELITYY